MVSENRAYEEFASYTGSTRGEFKLNDLNTPIPQGLPTPALYRMFVLPVGVKTSVKVKDVSGENEIGEIFLPDQSVDAELWLNALGRVAALGPACFKHPRYKELGMTEDDFPKVGDLILYQARAPLRFVFRDVRILVLNDDHWFANHIDPAITGFLKFYV